MLGKDGLAGLVCLAASLALFALTWRLPQPALVPVGPGFYPRIVLGITAVLAALLLVADLFRRRRAPARPALRPRANRRLVALTFLVFGGYVLALPWLGYRVATVLFVLLLQALLEPAGRRPWVRMAAVAVLTGLGTHLVFERYLSVLLPRGRWPGF